MIKVEGYSNLYRDEKSGAIVNSNDSDYNKRLMHIKQNRIQKKRDEVLP